MSAKWSLLCFRSRAWSRGIFRTCHWPAKWIRWLPIAVLIEAHNFILTYPTGSLLQDDGYLGDINNDVRSLYVEIIEKSRSYYKCTICGRTLSRKKGSKPTWAVFMAKVRNNSSQSQFWSCYYCTFHLYIKKDLYFAPKIKKM